MADNSALLRIRTLVGAVTGSTAEKAKIAAATTSVENKIKSEARKLGLVVGDFLGPGALDALASGAQVREGIEQDRVAQAALGITLTDAKTKGTQLLMLTAGLAAILAVMFIVRRLWKGG